MIHVNLHIKNPFKSKPFKNIWTKTWSVSKHRTLEIQTHHYAWNIFEVSLDFAWNGSDHAGPSFEIGAFGWYISISLPDNRHWDHNTNTWITHTD